MRTVDWRVVRMVDQWVALVETLVGHLALLLAPQTVDRKGERKGKNWVVLKADCLVDV